MNPVFLYKWMNGYRMSMTDTMQATMQRVLRLVDTLYPLGMEYPAHRHDTFDNWYTETVTKGALAQLKLAGTIDAKELQGTTGWTVDGAAKEQSNEFDTAGAKVWFFNTKIAKKNSDMSNATRAISKSKIPTGVNVFQAYTDPQMRDAAAELVQLFKDQETNPNPAVARHRALAGSNTGTKMLFYTPEREKTMNLQINAYDENPEFHDIEFHIVQPSCKDAVKALYLAGYEILAAFLVRYSMSIASVLECKLEYVENCGLMCLKYDPGSGIKRHIDGVAYFGNVFGPIFTLAMGEEGGKVFDMFPTLLDEANAVPVRISTNPFETMIVQGQARAEWSHSVPTGNTKTQYTIAFKFGNVTSDAVVFSEKSVYMGSSYPFVNFKT